MTLPTPGLAAFVYLALLPNFIPNLVVCHVPWKGGRLLTAVVPCAMCNRAEYQSCHPSEIVQSHMVPAWRGSVTLPPPFLPLTLEMDLCASDQLAS
jgi:hypothetical protein